MKVLLLGGYGQFGLPTAKQLARYDFIDEIVLAGRNLDRAQRGAAEVGPKARSLQLDADDTRAVEHALAGVQAMVSFMWHEKRLQESLLGAALRANAHYCSLVGPPPSEQLDAAAREADIAALVGVGLKPGLVDLMNKAAFGLLDEVEMAVSGLLWPPLQSVWLDLFRAYLPLPGGLDRGPHARELPAVLGRAATHESRMAAIRDGRVIELWLALLSRGEPERDRLPRWSGGRSERVDPLEAGVDAPLESGGFASVPAIRTLPAQSLFGAPYRELYLSGFAQTFTDRLHHAAARLRAEETDFATAVEAVAARLDAELDDQMLDPALFASLPVSFTSVYGRSGDRRARAAVWFPQAHYSERNWFDLTAANVAVSVARLLRGDIASRGAFPLPEADTLDDTYIAEVASRLPERPAGVPLIDQRIEFLDEGA